MITKRLCRLVRLLLCLYLFFTVNNVVADMTKKRIALVIGNSNYAIRPLVNPVNDAQDISDKLRLLNFDVMHHSNLGNREMKQVIRDFIRKSEDYDVVMFYYAGHGVQVHGENYLIPTDISFDIFESEIETEAVRAKNILGMMNEASGKTNLFFLDACRDNPFRSFSRSMDRGLAGAENGIGTLIAYATAPGSTASDGNDRNGIYTQHLLEYMDQPGLTVEQMLKKVRVAVLDATNNRQIPWENSSLRGDFCFAGCQSSEQLAAQELMKKNRLLQEQLEASQQKIRSIDELNQENERLTLQIDEIKNNFEQERLANEERLQKLADIQQQKNELEQLLADKRNTSEQTQIDLKTQLSELLLEKNELESKVKSTNQNNDLNQQLMQQLESLKAENESLKESAKPVASNQPQPRATPRYRDMPLMFSP